MSNADRKSNIPPESPSSTTRAIAKLTDAMALAKLSPQLADLGNEATGRALPIFDDVPLGCMIYQERLEQHEPHIHAGEFVVVDTNIREIVFGELYLVLQSNGPYLWQARRSRIFTDCAILAPLNGPRVLPDGSTDMSRPLFLGDGPIKLECLKRNLLGRVVGLINPRERADRQRTQAFLHEAATRIIDKPASDAGNQAAP